MDEYVMYFLRIFENDNTQYDDYVINYNENIQNEEIINNINDMINGMMSYVHSDINIDEIIGLIINNIVLDEQQNVILTEDEFDKLTCNKYKQNDKYTNCDICLEDYKDDEVTKITPCEHVYHIECLKRWVCEKSANCPSCRYDIKKYLLLNRNEFGRNI